MYYGWFDDSTKKTTVYKIEEAIDAYVRRFGKRPNVVLVNEADVADVQGVLVRPEGFIRRNNFWVGYESDGSAVEPVVEAPAPVANVTPQKRATRKPVKMAA